ncbi:MAG: ferredoxin-type protein NapH [Clostridia bacterium]|jgi:polyferredoxin|nr:ferredoxin-type protein NapH [Clostridia bacterium]MDN5321617.1 ferredoxin-type protein NapH [Clostridia bacterium]
MNKLKNYLWIVLLTYMFMSLIFVNKLGYLALICMFAPIFIAPFAGRKWCGSFCPRGSFLDKLVIKFSRNKDIPPLLLNTAFRWTIFGLLMSFFVFQVINAWGNWNKIGLVIASMVFMTTIIATIVGIFWRPRTWCVAFCPMGTLATSLSTTEGGIIFDQGCVSCGLCSRSCPMQLNTARFNIEGRVTDPRCIRCGECISNCPKNILSEELANGKLKERLAN